MPIKGELVVITTQKAINSFDFILAILVTEKIVSLTIAFYRIGKKVAIELNDLQKRGKIGNITFLINDGMPKLTPDAYNVIKSFESDKWKLKIDNNHTKVILCRTDKGNYYTVAGSGNLSTNARIEQYDFFNIKEVYDFHKNWIDLI